MRAAGLEVVYSRYTIYLLAELFMQTTKRAYLKSKKSYHSQSDVLDLTRNFKYKVLKAVFPALLFLFRAEEAASRALGLKGHCHLIVGRKP
jgi:hypothetical protein